MIFSAKMITTRTRKGISGQLPSLVGPDRWPFDVVPQRSAPWAPPELWRAQRRSGKACDGLSSPLNLRQLQLGIPNQFGVIKSCRLNCYSHQRSNAGLPQIGVKFCGSTRDPKIFNRDFSKMKKNFAKSLKLRHEPRLKRTNPEGFCHISKTNKVRLFWSRNVNSTQGVVKVLSCMGYLRPQSTVCVHFWVDLMRFD